MTQRHPAAHSPRVASSETLRIAVGLGGTDLGRSGIGVYAHEVIRRLGRRLADGGGRLFAFGTRRELDAFRDAVTDASPYVLPAILDRPAISTAWYLAQSAALAEDLGADVLLHVAGNRRTSARGRLPIVSVVHDLAQLHVPSKYDIARMLYARELLPRAFAASTALVTPSVATADDVVERLGTAHPHVVPNGVDAERFAPLAEDDPDREEARAALGVLRPYVLYPARFELPGKNHIRLLQAFASSSVRATHQLVLAGADWGGRSEIEKEIARAGLGKDVVLPGFIADDLLPAVFASADAVAMVGLREGFGLPAIEALAAGVPVAAVTTGALREVCGPLGVYADPYDVVDLRRALERVVNDQVLRKRVRFEGPVRAAAFSWDNTVDGLLHVCHQAVRA